MAGYAAALSIALDRVPVAELSAETEAELRKARDLAEAASQAETELLSQVSHELRTPLTAMIGFAELLSASPSRPSRSATSGPSSRRATTSSPWSTTSSTSRGWMRAGCPSPPSRWAWARWSARSST